MTRRDAKPPGGTGGDGGELDHFPMTIIKHAIPQHMPADERICFYCFRDITTPAVSWSGSTAAISLHPECVIELSIRLFRDVHEIECTTGKYITARTTDDLRRRLIAEEHGA